MKCVICFTSFLAFAVTASAQTTTPFSYTFSGNGSGSFSNFTLTGTGTITPTSVFGASTSITVKGSTTSGQTITFTVTFSDGDTFTATCSNAISTAIGTSTVVITGTANIISGTGAYAGASGSYSFENQIIIASSTTSTFTAVGNGSITTKATSTGGGGTTSSTAPSVANKGILNAASDAFVGLPNSSIAQGSIFTIYGTNLGPASSPGLSFPLQSNLGGVSIQVTSGGMTLPAIPMFVSPTQISAVLPDNTPVGNATLTVSYNNQISASASFQVVANSFGIFASNSAGSGPGIITNSNYQVLTLTSALHPGDVGIIWGTGLGASPNDNGSAPPPQTNLVNIPVSVYVGTTQATVLYRGRSFFTGEDQINFTVPSGVLGCHVPIAVQIGSIVSNFVTMPIAPAGTNVCTDPSGGPTASQISTYLSGGTVTIGGVSLSRTTSTITLPTVGTETTTTDIGSASFLEYTAQQLNIATNPFNTYTYGACTVYTFTGTSAAVSAIIQPTYLDAGSAITVAGPSSSQQLPKTTSTVNGQNVISYSASLGTNPPGPLFLNPGTFTVSAPGGSGANAAGAFSQAITLPPSLTWTNASSISTVNRANGQLITWTGVGSGSEVVIEGFSLVLGTNPNGSDSVGALFTCTVEQSAEQFTIPAVVLLSLPASGTVSAIPLGSLTVANLVEVPMTVPNVDIAYLSFEAATSQSVTFQ